jgi:hypothetical protein
VNRALILAILLAISAPAFAQSEWVTTKEPPGQCWQDLQAALPGSVDFDQASRIAHGARISGINGDISVDMQVLSEHEWDPKKKKPDSNVSVIVIAALGSGGNRVTQRSTLGPGTAAPSATDWGLSDASSSYEWRALHMAKAKIEGMMKAREKARK